MTINTNNWYIPLSQILPIHSESHKHVWLSVHIPLIHCGLHNAVRVKICSVILSTLTLLWQRCTLTNFTQVSSPQACTTTVSWWQAMTTIQTRRVTHSCSHGRGKTNIDSYLMYCILFCLPFWQWSPVQSGIHSQTPGPTHVPPCKHLGWQMAGTNEQ